MRGWALAESWKRIAGSPSRSFFVVVLAFLIGVGLAAFFDHSFFDGIELWLALLLVAPLAILMTDHRIRLALCILIAFVFGVLRYHQSFPPDGQPTVADVAGYEVVLHGQVVDEVVRRSARQDVTIGNFTIVKKRYLGKMLVRLSKYPEVQFGDAVTFRCKPELPEPIDGFRYDRLLASRGVLAVCDRAEELDLRPTQETTIRGSLFVLKNFLLSALDRVLPEPHASFVGGLLFGGSHVLGSDLREDFSRTGVSHIMAASGYNVAIFSEILLTVLMRSPLGRRRGLFVGGLVVVSYVLLAGATAPVVRAGAMALLAMLALWLGRVQSMRNILALTGVLMLLANPRLLLDDVGFQLSFVATIGIVFLANRVAEHLTFIPETFGFRASAAASLSATLLTTPILLWHFGTISLIAPLANLLILPWIPYLMFFGALAMVAMILIPSTAFFIALPAWAISLILLSVVAWLSAIPLASLSVPFAGVFALLTGIAMAISFIYILWKQKRVAVHS